MDAIKWILAVGLLLLLWELYGLTAELKRLRAVLTDRVGSLAEAAWRIRDELANLNKRQDHSN